jgi:Ca-activated chloride channel family protein
MLLRNNATSRFSTLKTTARVGLAAILALASLTAQPAKKGEEPLRSDKDSVIRVDTRLVVLHATVVDKSQHLVTNLPKTAFQVYENEVQQTIKDFKREDVPVSMGLIVDNSGSMRDKREKVKESALALVKDSNPQDEVFVVNFNDEAFLDTKDFTSNVKDMEEALSKIDSRGGTAMRDAIRMSIDEAKEKGKRDKKVLVVVTDGNDNSSLISLENLVRASQQSGIIVYTIGLLSEEEHREASRAKRALIAISNATGGQSYFPKDLTEVTKIAHQVAHDIRNQYIITYTPTIQALDGTFRKIRVVANGPNKPVVRTRSGYYATPDSTIEKNNTSAR